MKIKIIYTVSALVLAAFITGCGGNDNGGSSGSSAPAAEDLSNAQVDQSVTIEANDQMKYNIEQFEVNAGEVIELTLDNVGSMPKQSMGHNVVILEKGSDITAYAEAASTQATNDYIAPEKSDQVIAYTKLLGGGEKDTIRFRAPETTGEYPFLCSFPGHLQSGMDGLMIVK